MRRFVCTNCNYSFESDKIKKECPYCGEEEVIVEPSADDLIKTS